MIIESITQPAGGSTLEAVCAAAVRAEVSRIDVAVAYITTGGAAVLVSALERCLEDRWPLVKKRWITSFDYLRTEPLALDTLRKLEKSKVKIHDGESLLARGCRPVIPFHPKAFILTGAGGDFAIAGSGNASRSGLMRGHEAGFLIGLKTGGAKKRPKETRPLNDFKQWYKGLWTRASALNPDLLSRYTKAFESAPNLSDPTPTEDDVVPAITVARQLSAADLRKLRVCTHLWIEAGNPGRNLGDHRPGNQLMMKRLTRVYFGVLPDDVPENSALGHVDIAYGANPPRPCSLTFSDNGMDKVTLPVPGDDGPATYDGQNLLFKRIAPGAFTLVLGSNVQKASWKRSSKAIGAAFVMPRGRAARGREWGVF